MKNTKPVLEIKRMGTLGWHVIDRSGGRVRAIRCESKTEAIKTLRVRAFNLGLLTIEQ